jgi:hypothetical protein
MDDYVTKPVNPALLRRVLLRWMPEAEPASRAGQAGPAAPAEEFSSD